MGKSVYASTWDRQTRPSFEDDTQYPRLTKCYILRTVQRSSVRKLDLKWGYHQPELSAISREITTFATPDGLFRYKRLLFGVCSASEQYQHEIASVLARIEGSENISDDIVVHGPDTETHDKRLHQTMERLQESGLTLNAEKCLFNMDRLVFMGMLLSEKGIGPTEDRQSSQGSVRGGGTEECHRCA